MKLPFKIISQKHYRELLANTEYMKHYRNAYIEAVTNKNPAHGRVGMG